MSRAKTAVPAFATLIGIPYDGSSSYQRGAADGPAAIRKALRSDASNPWTELGVDTSAPGILEDAGDLELNDGEVRNRIESAIASFLGQGRTPLVLGGDHSITYPVLRALRPHHPQLTVLHFDAHPDLYDEFAGDRFSHACPFARVMEENLADRLIQVGIRTMNDHQRRQAERFGVDVVDMRRWRRQPPVAPQGPVYVSVDLDAFDPAFAPGVSHPEPGGLSVREVLDQLQSLPGPIVGADVVEFNPRNDPLGLTAVVCAKLLKELAGRVSVA